jgi:hypothetical protein
MTKLRTQLSVVAGFAVLSLAPALGTACEYDAATSASAAPPAQLASAPAPEVSKVTTSSALKAPAPKKTAKQVDKSREAPRSDVDVKVAVLTPN